MPGPYLSDPDCDSVTERAADLEQHIKMVHEHDRKEKEADAKKLEAEAKKLSAETDKYRAETSRMEAAGGVTNPEAGSYAKKGERKAPMERPSMDEGVTEGDWSFFLAEWTRYLEATGLKDDGPGSVCHLWSACSEGLRRALHNDGAGSVTDVVALLA